LRGYPAEWNYEYKGRNKRTNKTYKDYIGEFKMEFRPFFLKEKIIDKLKNLRMKKDYDKYKQQFKRLSIQIKSSEASKKRKFMKGLAPYILRRTPIKTSWTLEKMMVRVGEAVDYMDLTRNSFFENRSRTTRTKKANNRMIRKRPVRGLVTYARKRDIVLITAGLTKITN
jgi:Ty3 transposon capsid-like protein